MSLLEELVGCTLNEVSFSRFSYRLRFDGRRGDVPCFFDLLASGDLALDPAGKVGMQALSTALHPLIEQTVETAQLNGEGLLLRFAGFDGHRAEVVLLAGQGSPDSAFEVRVIEANSGDLKDWQQVS